MPQPYAAMLARECAEDADRKFQDRFGFSLTNKELADLEMKIYSVFNAAIVSDEGKT
jgi:hypothetical protein